MSSTGVCEDPGMSCDELTSIFFFFLRVVFVTTVYWNDKPKSFFGGLKLLQKGAIFGSRVVLARALWVRLLGVENRKRGNASQPGKR